jgi:hypothetical protein
MVLLKIMDHRRHRRRCILHLPACMLLLLLLLLLLAPLPPVAASTCFGCDRPTIERGAIVQRSPDTKPFSLQKDKKSNSDTKSSRPEKNRKGVLKVRRKLLSQQQSRAVIDRCAGLLT